MMPDRTIEFGLAFGGHLGERGEHCDFLRRERDRNVPGKSVAPFQLSIENLSSILPFTLHKRHVASESFTGLRTNGPECDPLGGIYARV